MLPDRVAEASAAVCETVLGLVKAQAVVAGYEPHRNEVDVRGALLKLGERGHSLCLPVIEGADKALFFRKYKLGDALVVGRYGIPIPAAGVPVFRPDVLLVPLVAFDRRGHRLGYGAGYYDRTIAALRERKEEVLIIGIAYAQQETEMVPEAAHDQLLDMVITENEIIRVTG